MPLDIKTIFWGTLTVFGFVIYVASVVLWEQSNPSVDPWQHCLDRGGVVVESPTGNYDGCLIGGKPG